MGQWRAQPFRFSDGRLDLQAVIKFFSVNGNSSSQFLEDFQSQLVVALYGDMPFFACISIKKIGEMGKGLIANDWESFPPDLCGYTIGLAEWELPAVGHLETVSLDR